MDILIIKDGFEWKWDDDDPLENRLKTLQITGIAKKYWF